MKLPVLIVLHQEMSTPGRVGNALRRLGFPLDIRRPRFGEPLPETMEEHAGVAIFGGPMSANDKDDWVRREIDWIALPLKEKAPFLGLCLGAQMLAHQLGARVYHDPQGRAEVGYYPIHPTKLGCSLCKSWPDRVYQWHREGFDLPAGADLLAEGETFPVQALRYNGSAYALQFHPEVTQAMMHRWTVRGHERMKLPNARPRHAHVADRAAYDYANRIFLEDLLRCWMGQDARH
jgi:GMP synthase (glutamine-hydrolysing)